MLHEDAELALARGYLPAIDHYYEITDNQLEYEFVIQNVRGGLSLQKTSDSPELTGADGKTNAYSLQGARYNVYKVGKRMIHQPMLMSAPLQPMHPERNCYKI